MQGLQYFLNSSLNSILCCSDVCWIGTRDRNGKMCLIDPQAHTCVTPADGLLYFGLKFVLRTVPRTENTIYWDGGKKKIAAWKEQHLPHATSSSKSSTSASSADHGSLCEHNPICSVLELRTLEMEDFDEQRSSSSPSKQAVKKTNLDFLVHERNVETSVVVDLTS